MTECWGRPCAYACDVRTPHAAGSPIARFPSTTHVAPAGASPVRRPGSTVEAATRVGSTGIEHLVRTCPLCPVLRAWRACPTAFNRPFVPPRESKGPPCCPRKSRTPPMAPPTAPQWPPDLPSICTRAPTLVGFWVGGRTLRMSLLFKRSGLDRTPRARAP